MLEKEKFKDLNYVLKCFRKFMAANTLELNMNYGLNITKATLNSTKGDLLEWVDERYDYIFNTRKDNKVDISSSPVFEKFVNMIIMIRNMSHQKMLSSLIAKSATKPIEQDTTPSAS